MSRSLSNKKMMRLYFKLCVLLVWCSTGLANAQSSLSGRVIDRQTRQAMPYVAVSVPDLHMVAMTDSLGNYHFTKLPAATYQVEISALGFKTFSRSVAVNGPTAVDFELDESATELAEVVVTGSSKAVEIRKSRITVTNHFRSAWNDCLVV